MGEVQNLGYMVCCFASRAKEAEQEYDLILNRVQGEIYMLPCLTSAGCFHHGLGVGQFSKPWLS